jgi:hypothetical protein
MEDDKIPPLLSGLKKNRETQLGKVPDDYFSNFESELMKKIDSASKNKKIRRLNPNYIMAAAASVLLLIIVGLWFIKGNNPLDYDKLMSMNIDKKIQGLETAEVNSYLLAEIDEISTDDLTEGIDLENLDYIPNEKAEIFPADSLSPPKTNVKIGEAPKNTTTENPEKEELLDNVADDSDLDELLLELDDEEFKALELSILKAKKKPN